MSAASQRTTCLSTTWLVLSGLVITLGACQKNPKPESAITPDHDTNKVAVLASQPTAMANDEIQLLTSDVITAKAERYQPNVTVTGTLQTSEHRLVQSPINAQVKQVLVNAREAVDRGQPLVRLGLRDSKDQLAQAQADLVAAKTRASTADKLAERNKKLLDEGLVSQVEYERSVADVAAQQESIRTNQAQLDTAKKLFSDTTVTAPIDGIISSRNVHVGQIVKSNQALLEIINPNKLGFVANVPSEAKTQLHVGQSVPFSVANNPHTFVGQIARISPEINAVTHQLAIHVAVKPSQNNQPLRAGMFATGKVDYGQIQVGVLLPISSVTLDKIDNKSANPVTATNNSVSSSMSMTKDQQTGMSMIIGSDHRIRHQPVQIIKTYEATNQYLVTGIEQGTVVIVAKLNADTVGKKVVLK